jgi:nucleoside-diphosphate-sugar epimerase
VPSVSGRRILITGGAGFIGGHLAEALSADEANELVLVDNFTRGRRDPDLELLMARSNVRVVPADLTDPSTYAQLGQEFDEVYHLAAIIGVRHVLQRPQEVLRVNALATLLLLEWLARGGGRRLLFASTSEVYAWTGLFHELPVPTPEDIPLALTDLSDPRVSYAGSKIFGELLVTQWCRAAQVPSTIVRYHNVYGPRMGFDHVIPELYRRAADGQDPLVVYSAAHRRAFCYVSDAIEATIAAMRTPGEAHRTFNVGNDRAEVTIADLARRLLTVAGIRAEIRAEPSANDPIRRRCPDISRARTELGFEPKVELEAGLERTLSWYAAQRKRPAPQTVGKS